MDNLETWRDIPGFEGRYQVSDHGRVRSLRRINGRVNRLLLEPIIMRQRRDKDGYRTVTFCVNYYKTGHRVGRLVLIAFVGQPSSEQENAHLDNDKENNCLSNLSWETHVDNIGHKVRHGTAQLGMKHGMAKLSDDNVRQIRRLRGLITGERLSEMFGVSAAVISKIQLNKLWKHIKD